MKTQTKIETSRLTGHVRMGVFLFLFVWGVGRGRGVYWKLFRIYNKYQNLMCWLKIVYTPEWMLNELLFGI